MSETGEGSSYVEAEIPKTPTEASKRFLDTSMRDVGHGIKNNWFEMMVPMNSFLAGASIAIDRLDIAAVNGIAAAWGTMEILKEKRKLK